MHKKGFATLLAALPRVLEATPEAYCVIGGEGDLRVELREQAGRLGVAERILFPGHIGWGETPDYDALCAVFVVPSVVDAQGNVDGLPNVLLEAMAGGRAIVASRVAGIPEVVTDGESGLLVTPGDVEELAASLIRLLNDPTLRARLGRHAQQVVAERYRWAQVAQRFVELYADALEKHGRLRI